MTTAPPCGREIKTSHCSAVDHFFSAILITLRALQTGGMGRETKLHRLCGQSQLPVPRVSGTAGPLLDLVARTGTDNDERPECVKQSPRTLTIET